MTIITLKNKCRKWIKKIGQYDPWKKKVNFKPPDLELKYGKERNNAKNWDNSCYPKGTYSLQRDRLRSKHFSQQRLFWNQETLKRLALDDDRFNVVIGWHIMASALSLLMFCSFTKRRRRFLCHLQHFEIQAWFGFNMSSAAILSTTCKRHTFHPFLTFSNQEKHLCNIPGISHRTFMVVVERANYYCHLSQRT